MNDKTKDPSDTSADRRDAERWRHLRLRAFKDEGNIGFALLGAYDEFGLDEDSIDRAIDAAIARDAQNARKGEEG